MKFINGKFSDKVAIEKLDLLTPLLGYDWKKVKKPQNRDKSFKQHISEIKSKLKKNENLNKTQRELLRRKRIEYTQSPESFSKSQFNNLESLIPLLGRDWKKMVINYGDSFLFETRIKLLAEKLKSLEELDQSDKDFLRKQRYHYRNDPKVFDEKRILLLDKLNDLLGYDWKLYKKELKLKQGV